MKLIALILSSILVLSCTNKSVNNPANKIFANSDQSSIINGTPVTADNVSAKSVVGLLVKYYIDGRNATWLQSCTGSVLNSKFILTAAHCVKGSAADELLVHFSLKTVTYDQQRNPLTRVDAEKYLVTRKVKAISVHPDYQETGSYDLAIIMLEESVPADAIPVKLLPEEYLNSATEQTTFEGQNLPVTLIGFGVIKEKPVTETDVLRQTTVSSQLLGRFVVTDQTKGSGGCNGDSGGPAFLTFNNVVYQVGVTHGPHGDSRTCHEEGEWYNPSFDKGFLKNAQEELLNAK